MADTYLTPVTITRYKSDARRCGMYQGPGPAWVWSYKVHCDGKCHTLCEKSHKHDVGTGLVSARDFARDVAIRIATDEGDLPWYRDHVAVLETWNGGREYTIGPRGGLRRVK